MSRFGLIVGLLFVAVFIALVLNNKQDYSAPAFSAHTRLWQCNKYLSSINSPLAQFPQMMMSDMGDAPLDSTHYSPDDCINYWSNPYMQMAA